MPVTSPPEGLRTRQIFGVGSAPVLAEEEHCLGSLPADDSPLR